VSEVTFQLIVYYLIGAIGASAQHHAVRDFIFVDVFVQKNPPTTFTGVGYSEKIRTVLRGEAQLILI
jgi:hypothetical protein